MQDAQALWAMRVVDAFQEAGHHVSPPKKNASGWVLFTRHEGTWSIGRYEGASIEAARLKAAEGLWDALPEDVKKRLPKLF